MTTPNTERLLEQMDAARNAQAIDPLTRAATALYYRIEANTPAAEAIAMIRAGLADARATAIQRAADLCRQRGRTYAWDSSERNTHTITAEHIEDLIGEQTQ